MVIPGLTAFLFVSILSFSLFLFSRIIDPKVLLKTSIIILTIFLAIRYNWGTDYPNYHIDFNGVVNGGVMQHFRYDSIFDFFLQQYDIGWYALFGVFKHTSFYFFIASITIFEMVVVYFSITKYIDRSWYWLAFFVFVYNTNLLLMSITMMRQFFAQILFLLATHFIDRKFVLSIVLMMLAVTIHMSAIYFLLVVFFVYLYDKPISVKKFVVIICFLYCCSSYIPFSSLLSFGNEKIDGYLDGDSGSVSLGYGVLYLILVNVILVSYSKALERKERFIVYLSVMSCFLYPLMGSLIIFQRLVYYHIMYSFLAIPLVFQKTEVKRWVFIGVFVSLCIFYIIGIYGFFTTSVYSEGFSSYQTIFSSNDF